VRFITEITKENVFYTKAFVQNVELRHLDGVGDAEYIAISTTDTRSTGLAESKSMGIIIPHVVSAFGLLFKRRSGSGSLIGGIDNTPLHVPD
jgi:hypothetical protein